MDKPVPVPLLVGDPMIVSQAPPEIRGWGPWQFPYIERLADGTLHVRYHVAADSATAYGLPTGHALSSDEGQNWQVVEHPAAPGGLLLPNGDRLRSVSLPSLRRTKVSLPRPVGTVRGTYGSDYHRYRAQDVAPDLAGWRFARLSPGETEWREERATMHIPGEVRQVAEDVLVFPWLYQDRLQVAPDGSLWTPLHLRRIVSGKLRSKLAISFLSSADDGHTWGMVSEIPYLPDRAADPDADRRDGFTEPDCAFMPDGTILCLLRTTDGIGIGPMYVSRSTDGGHSWSEPRVFDSYGVWPQLLTLGCGTTLAAYGRPGLCVRATNDPSGWVWGDRYTVVEPGGIGTDTCSYSSLIALDAHTALIAYSDFHVPDRLGEDCKTILVRRITV